MKYILLDTNIVIDMVVDRRNQMSSSLLNTFIKLLDYDEIKLIVPQIVEYETYKHLDEELEKVGKNIEKAMDTINDLYGVTAYKIDGLDIKEYKKQSVSHLNQALDMFTKKKTIYKEELFNIIKRVFEHKNSIRILDDSFLDILVMQRKIYKKAPFHKEKKESYADGLIVETLINIKKYINLEDNDIVYFVSGNYTDFCDMNNKANLHQHILKDLKNEDLESKVVYINTLGKLIKVELTEEIKRAELSEEFEKELKQEEEIEQATWESDYQDMIRESAGLSPLRSFENQVENGLIDSDFYLDLIQIFDQINKSYDKMQELECLYDEVLPDYICGCDVLESKRIVDAFSQLFSEIKGPRIDGEKISDIQNILEWIEHQKKRLREIPWGCHLPDSFGFGDTIKIYTYNHEELFFKNRQIIPFT